MDNQYLNLIDSCHAALEDLQKDIIRTRTALQEVLKMQEYEIHDNLRKEVENG